MAVARKCKICDKEFLAKPYLVRLNYANYCSRQCYWIGKRGKIMRNKGRPLTEEHRLKLSGENANNWQGGISSKNEIERKKVEYRLWRIAVFTRDNYTCQKCGKKGDMHAHHIKSFSQYSELRYAIDNGQTLCTTCHLLTENYGGRIWL